MIAAIVGIVLVGGWITSLLTRTDNSVQAKVEENRKDKAYMKRMGF